MTQALRVPALVVVLLGVLAGCTGATSVDAGDVEDQAREQFEQQFPVDSVECSDDLPAEVGATATCVLVSEGTSFEMTATVTEVEGDQANFDLELTRELDGEGDAPDTTDDEPSEGDTTS